MSMLIHLRIIKVGVGALVCALGVVVLILAVYRSDRAEWLQRSVVSGARHLDPAVMDEPVRASLMALRAEDGIAVDQVTAATRRMLSAEANAIVRSKQWTDEQFRWVLDQLDSAGTYKDGDPSVPRDVRVHRITDPPIIAHVAVAKLLIGELTQDQADRVRSTLERLAASENQTHQFIVVETLIHTSMIMDPVWRARVQSIVDKDPRSLMSRSVVIRLKKIDRATSGW